MPFTAHRSDVQARSRVADITGSEMIEIGVDAERRMCRVRRTRSNPLTASKNPSCKKATLFSYHTHKQKSRLLYGHRTYISNPVSGPVTHRFPQPAEHLRCHAARHQQTGTSSLSETWTRGGYLPVFGPVGTPLLPFPMPTGFSSTHRQ